MLAGVIGLLKQTNTQILEVLESDSEILARVQDSLHTMVRSRSQERLQPIWERDQRESIMGQRRGVAGGSLNWLR